MKKQPIPGSLRLWQLVVFLIAPVLCALVCLCIGRMNVPVRDLVSLLLGREVGAQARAVLWSMRLPRVLLAALVGAGLSVSGCVFQSLFANPLATPDTLGVASGASFGAALALLLGFRLIGVQLTAFLFRHGSRESDVPFRKGQRTHDDDSLGHHDGVFVLRARLACQIHGGHRVAAACHHLLADGKPERGKLCGIAARCARNFTFVHCAAASAVEAESFAAV